MAKNPRAESKWPEPLSKKLWMPIPKGKWWPLERIKPYAYNPRTHPPAQVKLLAQIFRKYGPDQPIIVDEGEVILKGHGRRLGAEEGELGGFWVEQRFGLSEADKRAMRVQDNQTALLSGWDTELVRFEIEYLKRADYPVELLGFGEAQLVQFTTTPSAPGSFPEFGEDIATEHQCPSCGYRWSGSTKAPEDKPAPPSDASHRPAKKGSAAKKKKKK